LKRENNCFNKEEILRNIDGVLDAITQELDESEASVIKKVEVLPLVLTPYSELLYDSCSEHELVAKITTQNRKQLLKLTLKELQNVRKRTYG
jgi:hypothetical protein